MKVRFTHPHFVGTRTHAKGEVAEFADAQAAALINDGHAQPVNAGKKLETATQPPAPETATLKDDPKAS